MNAFSTFHLTAEKVTEVRHWITEALEAGGITPEIIHRFTLAASEAVTNCIVHGYKPDRQGRVDLTMEIDDTSVRLTVRDFGSGLQMDDYDSPDTEKASEGGYGIYLIRSLMDDVRLIPRTDGTELTMSIFVKQAP